MCFRPATAVQKPCKECGCMNDPAATVCAKCGVALPMSPAMAAGAPGSIATPGAPAAPGVAPGVPTTPGVPGAGK